MCCATNLTCPNLLFAGNILTGFFYGVLKNRKLVKRLFYYVLKIRKRFDRFASLALKNRKLVERLFYCVPKIRKRFDRFVLRILKIRSGLTLPFKNLYKPLKYLIQCLGWEPNSRPPFFLGLGFILSWVGIKLRITHFHRVRFEILHLSWTRNELRTTVVLTASLSWVGIKLKTTVFLRVRIYSTLSRSKTQDHRFSYE